MLAAQSEAIERALWAALRLHEERAELYRRLTAAARAADRAFLVSRYEEQAREFDGHSKLLRALLEEELRSETESWTSPERDRSRRASE